MSLTTQVVEPFLLSSSSLAMRSDTWPLLLSRGKSVRASSKNLVFPGRRGRVTGWFHCQVPFTRDLLVARRTRKVRDSIPIPRSRKFSLIQILARITLVQKKEEGKQEIINGIGGNRF